MAILNYELEDGIVLQKDIYKEKTLLLKKGVVLNAYLLRKLNNFGISMADIRAKDENIAEEKTNEVSLAKFLIVQPDDIMAHITKSVLNYAGYKQVEIERVKNIQELQMSMLNLSYVFVDSKDYSKEFLSKLHLSKTENKITIFVLNCEKYTPEDLKYNTDLFNVKFLHRPLSKSYIKPLLELS